MHQLRSIATVRRFRFAALLFCLVILLFVAAATVLGIGLFHGDPDFMVLGIAGGSLAVICGGIGWSLAARAMCPLCLTPVLAGRRCVKHRRAATLLGSHRLRVATSILIRNSFRCPYCNESTAIKVRQRNHLTYPPRRS